MAVLEQEGYLFQPHASAGRVPTDKGYRFFVDSLPGRAALNPSQAELVRMFFARTHGELEGMLAETSGLLVEADRLRRRGGSAGGARAGPSAFPAAGQGHHPNGAGRGGAGQCGGRDDARSSFRSRCQTPRSTGRRPARPRSWSVPPWTKSGCSPRRVTPPSTLSPRPQCRLCALRSRTTTSEHVFVGGAARMATAFEAVGTIRTVLGILEQQYVLVALLKDVLDRGLTVAIGAEHGLVPLADCSVVVAPYDVDGERAGTVGVLGPTRMHYDQTLAAVAVVSKRVEQGTAGRRRRCRPSDQGRPVEREAEELQPWLRMTTTPSSASAGTPPRTKSSVPTGSWRASSTRTVTPGRRLKPRPTRSASSSSIALTRP